MGQKIVLILERCFRGQEMCLVKERCPIREVSSIQGEGYCQIYCVVCKVFPFIQNILLVVLKSEQETISQDKPSLSVDHTCEGGWPTGVYWRIHHHQHGRTICREQDRAREGRKLIWERPTREHDLLEVWSAVSLSVKLLIFHARLTTQTFPGEIK